MQSTINKLYNLITRLVVMLEDELDSLDELGKNKSNSAINIKKGLTETLHKLVSLIIQLNKASAQNIANLDPIMPEEDKKIIEQFLNKYRLGK